MRLAVAPLPLALAAVAATTPACTPRAVTPPARTFAFDSATAPAAGGTDVQLDVARIGTVWGPELVGGNARLRQAVRPGVVVEGELGTLHLLNDGAGGSRNAYTGRAGVLLRPPEDQELRVALALGVGGGHAPAAGSWTTVDLGGVVSGSHRWFRPVVGADLGYSRPTGDRTFTVTEPDGDATTLRLPANLTARVTAGVELGRDDRALLLGVSMIRFLLAEDSVVTPAPDAEAPADDDLYFALGVGARFALD